MTRQRWTEQENQVLREGWGKVRSRELAARLGRTYGAIKQRAMKLGLDAGYQYTDEEKALVRELYSSASAARLAEQVFGSPKAAKAIYRLAHVLGVTKHPHHPPEVLERVRALHTEGLLDRQIRDRMADVFAAGNAGRSQVSHIRHRLGLPRNEEAVLASRRQAVKTQQERLGGTSAGELRALFYRRYARENGWPEDLRPRAVQILNLLAAVGLPMSRRQIAEGIGMPWKGSRASLTSNDPEGSYLAHLAGRGLVQVLPRAGTVTGEGRGKSVHLYCLGPAALAILETRAREEEPCSTAASATTTP